MILQVANEFSGLTLLVSIGSLIAAGIIAKNKNRGFLIGAIWGLLLGPVGIVIALCLKDGVNHAEVAAQLRRSRANSAVCGSCGAVLTRDASYCPRCGTAIDWRTPRRVNV